MPRRLLRVALATGATALALLTGEVLWRVFRTARFGPTTNPAYVLHDADLGWRYRPLTEARHRTADFDVEVRINAQGFRDSPIAAPGERPRIVALGDSLTFGWGVEAEQTFSSRLEELLGADVLNLGVSGYGTDQELLLWEHEGRALQPQLVLLTLCANDLEEVSRPAAYGRLKPYFTLQAGELRLEGRPVPEAPVGEWSHLLRSTWSWWIKRSTPPLDPSERGAATALQCAVLARLAADVRSAKAHLLIVFDGRDAAPGQAFTCASEDWLALDVGPALEAAARTGAVRFATDAHWSPHGHQAVAEAIATRLRETGWLP